MRYLKKSYVFSMVMLASVILLGANAALAGGPTLEVSFAVPASVNLGATFTINVTVTNYDTVNAITFNKVAAGYALADMKVKGPYEVYTTSTNVPKMIGTTPGTATFSFNFRIFYGSGSIVPVAVIFAQDSYQSQAMRGRGIVGIKVN